MDILIVGGTTMSFIQYRGLFEYVKFEPLIFEYKDNDIKNLKFFVWDFDKDDGNPDSHYVYFKFTFNGEINDIEKAKKITEKPLNDINNLLLYIYGLRVRDIEVHQFAKFAFLNGSITRRSKINDNFNKLHNWINDVDLLSKLENNIPFRLYKSAIEITDPFGKFMFLYSILYNLMGTQNKVEDYIKDNLSGVEMLPRIRSKQDGNEEEVIETVFTWIRNHIGHTHVTTDMELIKNLIKKNTGNLSHLVKKAIFN